MRYLTLLALISACTTPEVGITEGDDYDVTVEVSVDPEPTRHLITIIEGEYDDLDSTFVAFGHIDNASYTSDTCVTAVAWSTSTPYWADACAFVLDGTFPFTIDLWGVQEDDQSIVESWSWVPEEIDDLTAEPNAFVLEGLGYDLRIRVERLD